MVDATGKRRTRMDGGEAESTSSNQSKTQVVLTTRPHCTAAAHPSRMSCKHVLQAVGVLDSERTSAFAEGNQELLRWESLHVEKQRDLGDECVVVEAADTRRALEERDLGTGENETEREKKKTPPDVRPHREKRERQRDRDSRRQVERRKQAKVIDNNDGAKAARQQTWSKQEPLRGRKARSRQGQTVSIRAHAPMHGRTDARAERTTRRTTARTRNRVAVSHECQSCLDLR